MEKTPESNIETGIMSSCLQVMEGLDQQIGQYVLWDDVFHFQKTCYSVALTCSTSLIGGSPSL